MAATPALTPRPTSEVVSGAPTPRRQESAGTGTLNVSARPTWATIRIDGRTAGSTPTVIRNVQTGSHSIEALPRGKGPGKRKTVTIGRDKVSNVEFVFE